MSPTFDIIVIGSYSVDLIFTGMKEFPQLGKDIVSTGFLMTPGEAYISAVSMHRLGIKVGWAADFGTDEYSQFALKKAREEGLDESLFVIHDRPIRRISAAASFPHERGFLTYYDPDPEIPAAIPALMNSNAKILLIPGLYYGSLLNMGMKLVRLKKIKLVMDGNSSYGNYVGKSKEGASIRKAIKFTDVFLPNSQEAKRLTGEEDLSAAIHKLGELCPLVVVKDGANGSYAFTNGELLHVPGIPANPIDTVGAGDNFNSGFLRAWLDGSPLQTCLRWGNIAGGLSTTEPGGTTHRTSVREINEILSRTYPSR